MCQRVKHNKAEGEDALQVLKLNNVFAKFNLPIHHLCFSTYFKMTEKAQNNSHFHFFRSIWYDGGGMVDVSYVWWWFGDIFDKNALWSVHIAYFLMLHCMHRSHNRLVAHYRPASCLSSSFVVWRWGVIRWKVKQPTTEVSVVDKSSWQPFPMMMVVLVEEKMW